MKTDIFISYRRKGAKTEAVVLYYKLRELGYRVFLDFASLHSGKFSEEIRESIAGCTDFLLLIHPTAFNRCQEENDCFRMEVECALENGKNIIPILLNQKDFPDNIPKSLLPIKDYNSIHYLPLEYADEMAARLAGQYLKASPQAPEEITAASNSEIPEEEDTLDRWINLREEQWKKCKLCGGDATEIVDKAGEFQKELEDIGRFLEGARDVSLLMIPLVLVVVLVPPIREWFITLSAEHFPSLLSLYNNEIIPAELKIILAVMLPMLVGIAVVQTRNILIRYGEIIALREEEEYYKARCTCDHCKASVCIEIPTWNLAKEKTQEEQLGKLGNGILAAFLMAFIFVLADVVSPLLHPIITWLAWPIVTALLCVLGLIWAMIVYAKIKEE